MLFIGLKNYLIRRMQINFELKKNNMKHLLSGLFAIILFSHNSFAQEQTTKTTKDFNFCKNNVKVNLFALPLRSFSLQYERGLNRKISVSLGVRLLPNGHIPFHSSMENAIDNSSNGDTANAGKDFVKNAQISSWAITPEFRYYFGKKPLNGFYIAPYFRIDGYTLSWKYNYKQNDSTIRPLDFKGSTGSFTGGLLLGAQWHIGKHLLIDWWILGPQYGSYTIDLNANTDLTTMSSTDKQNLKDDIEGFGFSGNKFKATVTNNGVKANNKLSLPGLRTGLCVGYTF